MIGLFKQPRRGLVRKLAAAPAAALTVVVLALSGCTEPPRAPDKVVTASLQDGAEASVVFPGHSDLNATVESHPVTPEMTAALPTSAAHLSNVAEFTLAEGEFPESGAEVSFTRKTPPPSGAFSVISHWNEVTKVWEPVKTRQSDDRLTLTAAVAHFSSYSIVDFFQDLNAMYQGGRVQADGWAAEHDDQAIDRAINGSAQWFGVQAAPPVCEGTPKPAWAEVLGQTSITSIITSCASGSKERPDNLVVKVTVNRSYAGYFRTAAEPISATQDGFDISADADPAVEKDTLTKGYFDWKAVGSMMVNSGLMSPGGTGSNIYPAMPFATYTFEFAKRDVLLAWPDIKALNKELISFDTEWQLALGGLLAGVVDAAVVNDNGEGKIAFVVVALQVNDCLRSVNVSVKDTKVIPSADNLLSIVNCVSVITTDQAEALGKRAGLNMEDRVFRGKPAKEVFFDPFLKAARKVFTFVAGVEIGATVGTAINDFTSAVPADRNLYFNPAGEAIKAFDAAPWSRYVTTDRLHEFIIPSVWKVVPGEAQPYPVDGQNLAVVNDKGETMSVFQTGWMQPMGQSMHPSQEDMVRDIDAVRISGLKPVMDTTENMFSYQAINFTGDEWNASMGIHSFLKTDTRRTWSRGFDISKQGLATIGGSFGRSMKETTVLTGVDPGLKGVDRFSAYYRTPEYCVIKTMLESLSDHAK